MAEGDHLVRRFFALTEHGTKQHVLVGATVGLADGSQRTLILIDRMIPSGEEEDALEIARDAMAIPFEELCRRAHG